MKQSLYRIQWGSCDPATLKVERYSSYKDAYVDCHDSTGKTFLPQEGAERWWYLFGTDASKKADPAVIAAVGDKALAEANVEAGKAKFTKEISDVVFDRGLPKDFRGPQQSYSINTVFMANMIKMAIDGKESGALSEEQFLSILKSLC